MITVATTDNYKIEIHDDGMAYTITRLADDALCSLYENTGASYFGMTLATAAADRLVPAAYKQRLDWLCQGQPFVSIK